MAHPKAKAPRTASKITREFFQILDAKGVSQARAAKEAGIHVNTVDQWKTGRGSPNIINLEAALAVLGFELAIRPIDSEPEGKLPR